ncbi:MAG: type secretion system rane protein PorP/SprF [Flavipsychrobacter sp.]|nr:type secretion system rane protein PorP/SprF [Flavipsychrobacter sp.]
MIRRNIISRLSLAVALTIAAPLSYAQDIHFTQFDMAPLVINPAFTGMFDGQVRAAAIYRSQWASVTVPYVTYGASVDLPIVIERNGDYLAGGLQLYNDKAGDGNLQNFTGLASVAYHKFFGQSDRGGSDLAVGLQGGYANKSIDLSKLYFGDEYVNGTFVPGTSNQYKNGIGNSVNYYLVNAGISFSQSTSEKFGYTIGLGGNNLNQPNDAIEKKRNSETGLDMRYTAEIGANWLVGQRLSLRPAILYQSQSSATEIIAGNEFRFDIGHEPGFQDFSTALFVGAWYRTGDATMITAGVDFKGFRIGVGYDYNISDLNTSSNGNGGFEIAIRYIAPNPIKFANKRTIPCSRF